MILIRILADILLLYDGIRIGERQNKQPKRWQSKNCELTKMRDMRIDEPI